MQVGYSSRLNKRNFFYHTHKRDSGSIFSSGINFPISEGETSFHSTSHIQSIVTPSNDKKIHKKINLLE